MNKIILTIGVCLLPLLNWAASGQENQKQKVYKYWVQFTDKKETPYSIDKPEAFLTERALLRRQKQQIAIDERDIPVVEAYVQQVSSTGVQILNRSRWFNAVTIATEDTSVLEKVRAMSFVSGTELLAIAKVKPEDKADTGLLLDELMALLAEREEKQNKTNGDEPAVKLFSDESYGKSFNQVQMLRGAELHRMGYNGKGMHIAVLDAGFYKVNLIKAFEHLFTTNRILGVRDFVTGIDTVYEDDTHGMNVLSCMAGFEPGKYIGTAPGASYWLLRSEDAATELPIEEANWITAAEFADSVGVDMINSSLGYNEFDFPMESHTYEQLDGATLRISIAAGIASDKGILVCNSAGNEGNGPWKYIGAPADAKGIVSVGGVDAAGDYAAFSSRGPSADGRIKPTISAQGAGTFVASSRKGFYPSNGTSFSSPVLCGMIACLWQANPDKTNQEVIEALTMSGSQYLQADDYLGYGIPDFMLANRILGGDEEYALNQDRILGVDMGSDSKGPVRITFYSNHDQKVTFGIYNEKGKRVGEATQTFIKGNVQRFAIPKTSKLRSGNYRLKVKSNDQGWELKLQNL